MRKLLFILFLFGSLSLMAYPHHVFHHHVYHHHRVSKPTYHTPAKQYRSVRVVRVVKRSRPTRVINSYWRNGVLYYVILHPRKGYVYSNDLVLCEDCGKVLVKKRIRYCQRCIEKRKKTAFLTPIVAHPIIVQKQ